MGEVALLAAIIVPASVLCAALLSYLRTTRLRRLRMMDLQGAIPKGIHVTTLLKLRSEDQRSEVLAEVRDTMGSYGKLIFAGRAEHAAYKSARLSACSSAECEWHMVVLTEHNSEVEFRQLSDALGWSDGSARHIVRKYSVGMKVAKPFYLLAAPLTDFLGLIVILLDLVRCRRRRANFQRRSDANEEKDPVTAWSNLSVVDDSKAKEPFVMINLQKPGDAAQEADNAKYGLFMLGIFASDLWNRPGLLHKGSAVQVEDADKADPWWETVALMGYPSKRWFNSMVTSTYVKTMDGQKALGDTECIVCVPMDIVAVHPKALLQS